MKGHQQVNPLRSEWFSLTLLSLLLSSIVALPILDEFSVSRADRETTQVNATQAR